jgi:uncharacterized membrane protein
MVVRALHVLAIVLWLGGVALVTLVVLPAAWRIGGAGGWYQLFEAIERRFAWAARGAVLVAGGSGFYMTTAYDAWARFAEPRSWWLPAMVALWLLFALILFVAEPLFATRWLRARNARDPRSTYRLILRQHRILLVLAAITIFGAVAGSHGAFSG